MFQFLLSFIFNPLKVLTTTHQNGLHRSAFLVQIDTLNDLMNTTGVFRVQQPPIGVFAKKFTFFTKNPTNHHDSASGVGTSGQTDRTTHPHPWGAQSGFN
jgi:hypothetical protein